MRDASQRGETGASGGEVGRTPAVVDRQTECPAARGEPADDVAVNPCVYLRIDRLSCKHASVTAFHGRFFSRM
jgi:hypothetical protein